MIDSTFVETIQETAVKAASPVTMEVPGESKRYFLQKNKDGTYLPQIKRTDKKYQIITVRSIADFAANNPVDGVFYVDRTGIDYSFTEGDLPDPGLAASDDNYEANADLATLGLKKSKQMLQLEAWDRQRTGMEQKALVPILRTTFREQTTPGNALSSLERVTWKIGEDGNAEVGQRSRSVGKSIEAKLEGRNDLPDVIVFKVPAWDSSDFQYEMVVSCVLEIDPLAQTFFLTPFPGMIEKRWGDAEFALGSELNKQITRAFKDKEKVPPIYAGGIGE